MITDQITISPRVSIFDKQSPAPIDKHRHRLGQFVARGGPTPPEYDEFTQLVNRIHRDYHDDLIDDKDLELLREDLGDALSEETMQGFALLKPHGYAGDFEIIDRIYQKRISENADLARWDEYYHAQAAPRAVRNRKQYFHYLLDRHLSKKNATLRVLNVGSGPARCISEYLAKRPEADIHFDCLEIDPNAIEYAQTQLGTDERRVSFHRCNVVKFKPSIRYDFIWASGIFDYFSNRVFERVLGRLMTGLEWTGEIVVGNFSPFNPSLAYMEMIGDWPLHHRSSEQLTELVRLSGASEFHHFVVSEPEGVNLFLHISNWPALDLNQSLGDSKTSNN